jgi:hypothetical protein
MWKYVQRTGNFYDPDGKKIAKGYAGGDHGLRLDGVNNPDLQSKQSIGPLPVGLYTHGTAVEGSHLGAFAIPLIPDSNNEMFGRSGFFMHGDRLDGKPLSASDGCIIVPKPAREAYYNSPDSQLQVVAEESA